MKKYLSLLCITFSIGIQSITAQNYEWGYNFSFDGNHQIHTTVTNQEGAVYNIGSIQFKTSLDLDPDSVNVANAGYFQFSDGSTFIQKLDSNGNFLWSGQISVSPNTRDLLEKNIYATNDADDFLYIAGYSPSTKYDVDPKIGAADTFYLHTDSGVGYITKVDKEGNLIWAKNFARTPFLKTAFTYSFSVLSINTDMDKNVYISGFFTGDSVDFDPGTNDYFLTNDGGTDGFLLKLDKNGNFKWVVNVGGDRGWQATEIAAKKVECACDKIYHSTVDDSGNVLLTGIVSSADTSSRIDMNPSPLPKDTFFIPVGEQEIYVMKLDSNGAFKWVQKFDGTSINPKNHLARNIYLNEQNELFLTGSLTGTVFFDPDSITTTNGSIFTFLSKLQSDGTFEWVKLWNVFQTSSTRDPRGRFYFAGRFVDIDFDPGAGVTRLEDCDSCDNVVSNYVLALEPNGSLAWVKGIESNFTPPTITSLSVSIFNDVFIGGYANGIIGSSKRVLDADPSPGNTELLLFDKGIEKEAPFIIKWSQVVCGASTATYDTISVRACSFFTAPSGLTYDQPGTYNDTIPNAIGCDSIITIYLTEVNSPLFSIIDTTICINTPFITPSQKDTLHARGVYLDTATDAATGCDHFYTIHLRTQDNATITSCSSPYTSPSGNHTWEENGTYLDTVLNTQGCLIELNIHLTIVTIDNSIKVEDEKNNKVLSAGETEGRYQWVDCSSDYQEIRGANEAVYQTTDQGSYALIIRKQECIDTSLCIGFQNVSVVDYVNKSVSIHTYPNPVREMLYFNSKITERVNLRLIDMTGQVIAHHKAIYLSNFELDMAPYSTGSYLIAIQTPETNWHQIIIKE